MLRCFGAFLNSQQYEKQSTRLSSNILHLLGALEGPRHSPDAPHAVLKSDY